MVLLLALLGCAPPDDAADTATVAACDRPGDTVVGVMTTLVFARAADGVSNGFDLDDAVSTEDGVSGCGIADYVSPEGVSGVDNAFARLIPALEATEASAVEGLIQDAINSGELLLTYELSGVESLTDDACVDLTMGRALGPPSLGTDGYLETNQTFEHDPDAPESSAEGAAIVDGRLVAGPLDFRIPLQVLNAQLDFEAHDGLLQIDFHEDGSTSGVFAGSVDVQAIADVALTNGVDPAVAELLSTLLALNADLSPAADGTCGEISITFEFTGTPAFYFVDG